MKRKDIYLITIIFISAVFFIFRFWHQPAVIKDQQGLYVTKVIDGDTVELSNGEYVRYIGIDTPELRKMQGAEWVYNPMPYAEEARDFNQRLVEKKSIRLEFDVQKKDKYNRLLAYVYSGDKMVNLEMVREGCAMIYTYHPNVKYIEEFTKAQKEARENKKGLWKELETNVISSSEAGKHIGLVRMVETEVYDTFLSEKVLILNCRDDFKVAIFRNNLAYFPKEVLRSPDTYFRHKAIRVYGVIKDYKGSPEIILNDASQLQLL